MNNGNTLRPDRGCTPHLFAILIILIILLIAAKFTFPGLPEPTPISLILPTATLIPSPVPKQVDIFILPKTLTVSAGNPFSLNVFAETQAIPVTAIDLSLNFDQKRFKLETASPAAFFAEQVVFINEVDNEKGSIRLALGSLTPASSSGVLFRLSGIVLPTASGSASINFLPSSRVGEVGTAKSVLGKKEGARLEIL